VFGSNTIMTGKSKSQKIIRFHFFLFTFLLFNFVLKATLGFGINNTLAIVLKCLLYLTGIVLFFISLRPFKKFAVYFSFYILTPIILALFYFVHGIFFGLLSSLLLTPIMPVQPNYNDGNIKVYSKFNGFLGPCCKYYATQNRLYVFEEFKGTIYTDGGVNFENAKVTLRNDSALIYSDKVYRVKLN